MSLRFCIIPLKDMFKLFYLFMNASVGKPLTPLSKMTLLIWAVCLQYGYDPYPVLQSEA